MRRRVLSCGGLVCALAGCWADDSRVGGFTSEQWTALQEQYKQPEISADCPNVATGNCDDAARLGQKLFFEPALSSNGQVACVTCHDPKRSYVDARDDNGVSLGAVTWTKRNTISLVNIDFKPTLTWTGACDKRPCLYPENVITDIALPKAMNTSPALVAPLVASVVRGTDDFAMLYNQTFNGYGSTAFDDDNVILTRVSIVLTTYMRRLVSLDAPFDQYIKGNASALSESAQRGFELFVGKAMCAECHSGGAFSDGKVHVTGVQQNNEHWPDPDLGAGGTGGFFTPPLRGIAETAPYMHDGSIPTLAGVIELYRRGGDASGYTGVKDPLMQPLDITDDEARDLESFLKELTGERLSPSLTTDIRCAGGVCGPW